MPDKQQQLYDYGEIRLWTWRLGRKLRLPDATYVPDVLLHRCVWHQRRARPERFFSFRASLMRLMIRLSARWPIGRTPGGAAIGHGFCGRPFRWPSRWCFATRRRRLSTTGKIVWAIATYNLLMFIYAANNIPYCALSGVMTTDSHERTSLASWRFVCAMAAALVVNVFTVDLVERFGQGNADSGLSIDDGASAARWPVVFFVITFAFTKERSLDQVRSKVGRHSAGCLRLVEWTMACVVRHSPY